MVPAVLGLLASFTTYDPFGSPIRFVGFANYLSVLRDPTFTAAARNIAVFTLVAVPLELGIGFALAYLLRGPMPGRELCRVLLLVPWLVSPIGGGVMWHFLFGSATGIPDYVAGWIGQTEVPSPLGDVRLALPTTVAIEVWRMAPLVGFLLLPGLTAIPRERWDLATLDGAPLMRRVTEVALPPLGPLLLAITMLLVGFALGTFDAVLILTGGGPGTATETPALYSYQAAFGTNDWHRSGAAAWLVAAGVLAIGFIYLRLSQASRRA